MIKRVNPDQMELPLVENEYLLPIIGKNGEIKGNRGEWGEFYTFLRLIKDGVMIEHGDESKKIHYVSDVILLNPNRIKFKFRPKKIETRNKEENIIHGPIPEHDDEIKEGKVYIFNENELGGFNEKPVGEFDKQIFIEACDGLGESLIEHKKSRGTFSLDKNHPAMILLTKLNVENIKADSLSKADITVTHAHIENEETKLDTRNYSIKSSLGSHATLFNAGKNSNVVYKILPIEKDGKPFNEELEQKFNSINLTKNKKGSDETKESPNIKERMKFLAEEGYELVYSHIPNNTFKENIEKCFKGAEMLIQGMLLAYYNPKEGALKSSKLYSFIENQVAYDPLGLKEKMTLEERTSHYESLTKNLLLNMAMGMTASTEYKKDELTQLLTGGILLLEEVDSEYRLFCRSIENPLELEDYLLHNTKLETASTSRHDFAKAYYNDESKCYEVKLNLQIRFTNQSVILKPTNENNNELQRKVKKFR